MNPLTRIQQKRLADAIVRKSGGRLRLRTSTLSQPQAILLWRGLCRIFGNAGTHARQTRRLTPFEQARFACALADRSGVRLDCSLIPMSTTQACALWDLVIKLSELDAKPGAGPVLSRGASAATLVVISLPLAACATLWGGNVKGNFSCSAPGGTCAPSTVIDDSALALIQNARPMTPASKPWSQPPLRGEGKVIAVAGGVAHRERRVLKVVFPAFVDQRGYLHEPRIVHAVADQGGWMQTAARTEVPAQAQMPLPVVKPETDVTVQPVAVMQQRDEQAESPPLSAHSAAPSLGTGGLPDPAKVAAARQLGKARLPSTPAEIKAVVEARLAGTSPLSDVAAAGGVAPVDVVQTRTEERPQQKAANLARPVNAPAAFPGHVEP